MFELKVTIAAVMCLGVGALRATGHGTPIELTVGDGALHVSHHVDGYPAFVFGQQQEESDPQGPFSHPSLGLTLLWGLPGIDITGMQDDASLSLEVLAPGADDDLARPLRYWSAASRTVQLPPADAELGLLLADASYTALPGAATAPPAEATLADTVAGETGFHNHGLVNFAMPYSPVPPAGLYGFFGRFRSDAYEPSEAFLVLFNLGVAYDDLAPASEALWASAYPGDYDHSGLVDAADYAFWRQQHGEQPSLAGVGADGNRDGVVDAADYTVWRDNAVDEAASAAGTAPEPASAVLAAVAALLLGRRRPAG
ncbi:hypothetical protein KOR34_39550 [Posidoniimonas corsicana]|uniref:PEP-CTERM protein-sorting domain-containing protein n=1 Tax=Posidoniimonas corsicana TaxID=1938618 RepID=A0A5C5V0L9_9BACT|nr:hypothetical protein [Posidoniimonas corsicana]TWT32194.1 hypothetical protein KOR34_39550 [Posidoniimonas corsicana]